PKRRLDFNNLDYYPIHIEFPDAIEEFHVGLGTATVPGAIAGMHRIHETYGSIPLKELFQPAIEHCKKGVPLDDFQAYDINLLQKILKASKTGEEIFFKEGRIKQSGEIIQMEKAADFLDYIAQEGEDAFYKGEIARSICEDCITKGAHLMRADFEEYKVRIHKPIDLEWKNYTIAVPGAPSIGSFGFALYWGLRKQLNWEDAEALKFTAENIRQKDLVIKKLKEIYPHMEASIKSSEISSKGTSHFSIVDQYSNAISLTTSIGEGCGYFIPGTQMHMNNMLGETYLLPGGAHSWTENVRLNSMMTPTIVLKDKELFFVTGSGGASRIPVAIKQVLSNLIKRNMSLTEATEAPRIHFQDNTLHLDNGRSCIMPEGEYETMSWSTKSLYFGGVNSVIRHSDDNYEAWADSRRLGSAGVYS
ncbi:MAG: gamma-glutamyltransferase family protein, partial [Bacteroidia bacterium]|nr:gamma-glutamyltransferase family protein [Bacteroidia bacterium]